MGTCLKSGAGSWRSDGGGRGLIGVVVVLGVLAIV